MWDEGDLEVRTLYSQAQKDWKTGNFCCKKCKIGKYCCKLQNELISCTQLCFAKLCNFTKNEDDCSNTGKDICNQSLQICKCLSRITMEKTEKMNNSVSSAWNWFIFCQPPTFVTFHLHNKLQVEWMCTFANICKFTKIAPFCSLFLSWAIALMDHQLN